MRNRNTSYGCLWIIIGAALMWLLVAFSVKADSYDEPVIPDIHRNSEPTYQTRVPYWRTLQTPNCVNDVLEGRYNQKWPVCKPEPKKIPEPLPLLMIGIGAVALTIWKRK